MNIVELMVESPKKHISAILILNLWMSNAPKYSISLVIFKGLGFDVTFDKLLVISSILTYSTSIDSLIVIIPKTNKSSLINSKV